MDEDLRPAKVGGVGDKRYFTYVCRDCSKEDTNSFVEPTATRMLNNRRCFTCDYWTEFARNSAPVAKRMTVIGGHVYTPGNRTSGSFRGMAGRRFDIEYVEPSEFAGQRITTFDLWSGSEIPKKYRDLFPDTAQFLNGAKKADAQGVTCWNASAGRVEPYPLPHTLKGLA